jgi:ribosomal protein S18 acetylase RimI-like enzyme
MRRIEVRAFIQADMKQLGTLHKAVTYNERAVFWWVGDEENWPNVYVAFEDHQLVAKGQVAVTSEIPIGSPSDYKHRIYINLKTIPEREDDYELLDLLYNRLLERVEELKRNLSTEYATLLGVGNDSSEEKNSLYFVNKGYSYETSLFAMRRDLAQSIQLQELAASYDCQLWTMDEEGDLEEYMKADSEIWPDASIDLLRLLQLRQRDSWTAIAIRDNGTLVGSVMAWTEDEPSDGIIEDVFVRERWRKQGIAKHLLLQALIYLKSLGCTTAELQVEVRNQAALALYHSAGFKETAEEKRYGIEM